jgi:hypothetical protein
VDVVQLSSDPICLSPRLCPPGRATFGRHKDRARSRPYHCVGQNGPAQPASSIGRRQSSSDRLGCHLVGHDASSSSRTDSGVACALTRQVG